MFKQLSTNHLVRLLVRLQSTPSENWQVIGERLRQFNELHAELDRRCYHGPRPSRKLKQLCVEDINAALYAVDPMQTGCRDYVVDDEYLLIAVSAFKLAQQGLVIEAALYQALATRFAEDKINGDRISEVIDVLVGIKELSDQQ